MNKLNIVMMITKLLLFLLRLMMKIIISKNRMMIERRRRRGGGDNIYIVSFNSPSTEDHIDITALDFQSHDSGIITIVSQNHPGNYSDNSLVSYIIEAPEGSYIFLAVWSLDTEYRQVSPLEKLGILSRPVQICRGYSISRKVKG